MANPFSSSHQACFTPYLRRNMAIESINLTSYSRILIKCVQAWSAITWNEGVNFSWRQFCSNLAEILLVFSKHITQLSDQRIGIKNIPKEVMEPSTL